MLLQAQDLLPKMGCCGLSLICVQLVDKFLTWICCCLFRLPFFLFQITKTMQVPRLEVSHAYIPLYFVNGFGNAFGIFWKVVPQSYKHSAAAIKHRSLW